MDSYYLQYEHLMNSAAEQLKQDEGLRLKPYKCTAGKLTIGYGRNIDDKGITKEEAEALLKNDIVECVKDLEEMFTQAGFKTLPFNIQKVLINMRYQLGGTGLRAFKDTLRACRDRQWQAMARQMQASKWYQQTTNRAQRLINLVRAETN